MQRRRYEDGVRLVLSWYRLGRGQNGELPLEKSVRGGRFFVVFSLWQRSVQPRRKLPAHESPSLWGEYATGLDKTALFLPNLCHFVIFAFLS